MTSNKTNLTKTLNSTDLENGLLLAWYGDDFTGAAAAMEVLAFAGGVD